MAIKLISLNIEGDNHYDRVFPFLLTEQPDVVCVQEFFLDDLPLFEETLSMHGYAVGMWTCSQENDARISKRGLMGVAIFSKLPMNNPGHQWYVGGADRIIEMFDPDHTPEMVSRALVYVDVLQGNTPYRIATTHFTWSPGGSVTLLQHEHLDRLLPILDAIDPVILCGDFNAPRGKEIFESLASRYTDNIPAEITTTMDQLLHRVSGLQFVVDVLFTSTPYSASEVRIVDGVSDHCAVVARLSR